MCAAAPLRRPAFLELLLAFRSSAARGSRAGHGPQAARALLYSRGGEPFHANACGIDHDKMADQALAKFRGYGCQAPDAILRPEISHLQRDNSGRRRSFFAKSDLAIIVVFGQQYPVLACRNGPDELVAGCGKCACRTSCPALRSAPTIAGVTLSSARKRNFNRR